MGPVCGAVICKLIIPVKQVWETWAGNGLWVLYQEVRIVAFTGLPLTAERYSYSKITMST